MNHTTTQYQYLERLYSFYNLQLFNGVLPSVLFTLSKTNKASGFFASERWKDKNGKKVHEISINPDIIRERFDIEMHQTLVHEMAHLWQMEEGDPGRKGYHNKEFADKMIEMGLMPSTTGREGGKTTGQNMSDYFIENGKFILAFKQIQENNFEPLPLEPDNSHLYCKENMPDGSVTFLPIAKEERVRTKTGTRIKYSCGCENNIWGKKDLKVYCLECNSDFTEQINYEY